MRTCDLVRCGLGRPQERMQRDDDEGRDIHKPNEPARDGEGEGDVGEKRRRLAGGSRRDHAESHRHKVGSRRRCTGRASWSPAANSRAVCCGMPCSYKYCTNCAPTLSKPPSDSGRACVRRRARRVVRRRGPVVERVQGDREEHRVATPDDRVEKPRARPAFCEDPDGDLRDHDGRPPGTLSGRRAGECAHVREPSLHLGHDDVLGIPPPGREHHAPVVLRRVVGLLSTSVGPPQLAGAGAAVCTSMVGGAQERPWDRVAVEVCDGRPTPQGDASVHTSCLEKSPRRSEERKGSNPRHTYTSLAAP